MLSNEEQLIVLRQHIHFDRDQKASAINRLTISVLGYWLGDRGIVVRLTAHVRDLYQIQSVQISSVAHPASMRTNEEGFLGWG